MGQDCIFFSFSSAARSLARSRILTSENVFCVLVSEIVWSLIEFMKIFFFSMPRVISSDNSCTCELIL